jgi:hypothetical protein
VQHLAEGRWTEEAAGRPVRHRPRSRPDPRLADFTEGPSWEGDGVTHRCREGAEGRGWEPVAGLVRRRLVTMARGRGM